VWLGSSAKSGLTNDKSGGVDPPTTAAQPPPPGHVNVMQTKKKAEKVKSTPVEKKSAAPAKAVSKPKNDKNIKDGKARAASTAQPAPAKGKNTGKRAAQEAAATPPTDAQKPGRLSLIKTRHEAMKREIDQIREDLETDEEE
jgi:hypothetical protein